jgi:hypothetical protein
LPHADEVREAGEGRKVALPMAKAAELSADKATMPNGNGRGKLHLLTRQSLDGRTRARKQFDSIATSIAADLGGEAQLSTIQKFLIEAFAGCAVHVSDLNVRLLLGQEVDLSKHAQACSSLVRIASRLPLGRVARQIPSMSEYLASLPPQQPAPADEVELDD